MPRKTESKAVSSGEILLQQPSTSGDGAASGKEKERRGGTGTWLPLHPNSCILGRGVHDRDPNIHAMGAQWVVHVGKTSKS